MKFFKDLTGFVQNVAKDERIPERDKKVLLLCIGLIVSPIDIIPDWIPVIGVLDDVVIAAIVLDYLFNHLDQEILLSHFPWDMKAYVRVQKTARFIATLTPSWVQQKVWAYKPSVY